MCADAWHFRVQDGFEKLNLPGDALRGRIRIQYVDSFGEVEAGVDGGGLFKDFMENLIKEGFDPRIGLFKATPDQKLYPNPAAATVEPNAFALFEFMGKMVGKALYEGILLEVPLAGFFLKKLLRRGCDLNDLPSLDAELYRQLLFLRDYDGDVEDLALTFTVTDSDFGTNREIELVPGSRERAVTDGNRLEYIHRVANFRLNVQIKRATDAFRRGLEDVIAREWITMFNEAELQALIGGGDHQGLDLEDMKQHVNYAGGYGTDHPVILEFWRALQDFTPEQQKAFLRFVTSCSRPPLLGFQYLDPKLCIQMAGSVLDEAAQERLPSASTCINLLKLPPYRSATAIRDKLLYAVKNVAGFDLS
ncbi:HECT-domain-containing protein [Coccomyxa subellipsoidea C-169]|uniref:HECT-type E3 ubiquitin transferase n=1 Tax=Coccomyxa subellipsoidea (strain C-169) TaxID=574566 RepID=I0YVT3_COCSC|nr:HECT-domain-containing protein [Coccomyxa subellipsoidea C-169]EIE22502.1 HECT-domain-containing protein [Coccomyxa subellipsoidea C-169]|eukprot:XP_005647046.1 HECT-domain-containing protein [Coccomyxa subellipsoidea C-169]